MLSGGIKLLEEKRYLRLNDEKEYGLLTVSLLLESFYKLLLNSMPPNKHSKCAYEASVISEFGALGFQWSRLFNELEYSQHLFRDLTRKKRRVRFADCT